MIIRDDVSSLLVGHRKALLINPPVYDTQYWAYWSQPHGLLKIAAWLRQHHGYTHIRLLDCLATDARRRVRFRRRPGGAATVRRGDTARLVWEYGWSLAQLRHELERHAGGDLFRPEEVWITSIMTYWWESTRDVVNLVRDVFRDPGLRVYVGGIYPTLCPDHADAHLSDAGEVIVVPGEICAAAANAWTDLSLYRDEAYPAQPRYAIITGSRGCPFACVYCAQARLNGSQRRVRHRDPEDIAEEIAQKQRDLDIHEIAFYEDNLIFDRKVFLSRLEAIHRRGLNLEIHAPEGLEPRLIDRQLLTVMREVGFSKLYLALETIEDGNNELWNRRQANIDGFERAVRAAVAAGYRVGSQDLNAFVLFGMPGESLQSVVNTALYASHRVGSVIPMLFTPVPGSALYDAHRHYLHTEMGWDLQHLNGKLLPFLEYNQQLCPDLKASDYVELEAFMMRLNSSKVYSSRFDFAAENPVARTFRLIVAGHTSP
jgi:hypothetical protein